MLNEVGTTCHRLGRGGNSSCSIALLDRIGRGILRILDTLVLSLKGPSKREQRGHLDGRKKPTRVLNTNDNPLCRSRRSQSEGDKRAVVDEAVRRVAVVDEAVRRVAVVDVAEDETSRRVCQTRGQLGTNARNGVANTARAR
uniref:Uncharacterized protein n=1 Tax=Oryza rufipogon TaxID=4529 RepID=A0A0E0PY64_ORYRU